MGSAVHIVVDGSSGSLDGARSHIESLEQKWSRFLPDSEITRMNTSPDWTRVSPETIELVDHAFTGWRLSGGAFDPTILPSLVANGYGESREGDRGRTVLPGTVTRGPAPGPAGIEIDRDTAEIRIPDGVAFDPGGIGKGFAADLVATGLIESGATAAIVSIGGDVRLAGAVPEGWVIAVENPFDSDRTVAQLGLVNGSVCTSSVRAKTWTGDGRTMHHLIDPASGRPVESPIVSATVVAAEAWMAEVLTKAAITSDAIGALAFLESAGVEGLVVDVDRTVWRTPGLERFAA